MRSAKLTVSSSGRWARARWGWAGGRESRRSRTAQLSAPHSVLSDQHLLDATNLGYRTNCLSILEYYQCLKSAVFIVADPHHFVEDLDFYFNVDQDPTFHFDTDPWLHCEHQRVKKELPLAPGFSQSDPGFKKAAYPGSGNATRWYGQYYTFPERLY